MNMPEHLQPPVIEYSRAKRIADRIYELLQPHCELIHIAGSIRRQKQFVKDIEIVCVPIKVFREEDMFGGGKFIVCPEFVKALFVIQDKIIKGDILSGRYAQIIIKGGITLDLFCPQKSDYYRQLVIRTGSKEFSNKIIAGKWLKRGWCGTHDGLRRVSDCASVRDKANKVIGWKCVNQNGQKPPEWSSEEQFFNWLGLTYVEPKDRN